MNLKTLFHTKICGVRLKQDIEAVGKAGADAIGLNFYPPSVRYVDPAAESTRQLSLLAEDLGLFRVGVFVNESAETIQQIAEQVGLDAIQLHGDEQESWIAEYEKLGNLPILRAIKLPVAGLSVAMIEESSRPWTKLGCNILFDADAGAAHGGSGKTLDWEVVGEWAENYPAESWTLAGGLNADNVAMAKRVSGATSVDTASGAESERGIKSADAITAFGSAAKSL